MPEIVLSLRREIGYDRQIMRGVIAAARQRAGWRVRVINVAADPAAALRLQPPDGTVGRFVGHTLTQTVTELGIPAVAAANTGINLPRVGLDETAIGRLAADELAALGFEHFAFVGVGTLRFSVERGEAFAEALRRRGRSFATAEMGLAEAKGVAWLRDCPIPLAIFAANDDAGQVALEWAHAAGLRVPDEVAVLGVDDDELTCETAATPLSSISVPGRRVGELAVTMLEQLMRTGTADPLLRLLPPTGVVHRRSTETQVAADPALAEALRFMRDHAHEPIQVSDVLDAVMISRRKLEGEFKRLLGRSPGAELRRVRVERAKRLLTDANLALPEVAEACGLASRVQLNRVFKAETGYTPAAYRRQFRA